MMLHFVISVRRIGYLRDEGCSKAENYFLKECLHLREYVSLIEKGNSYPTDIQGQNLKDMLNDYGQLKLTRMSTFI